MTSSIKQDISDTYTEVPYHSDAFSQSSPENLQAVATLFGLTPPDLNQARVLELGCASGGNLIPFAARYPNSTCVGLDLVELQIEQGQALQTKTGVRNLTLKAMSIEDIDSRLGLFDYIVCHGVYSWVPPSVQEAILRVCHDHLAPAGVAYISYNTYPGWKTKEIVRDAMLLRANPATTAQEKLGRAKGMVEFLHQRANANSVLKAVLDEALPILNKSGEHYLMHEYLELYNAPCYFKDFLDRAQRHGLVYLGEAEPHIMFASNYGQETAVPLLAELPDNQIEREQYLDFVSHRTFRQTLLVHAPGPQRNDEFAPDCLPQLHFGGQFELTGSDTPGVVDVRAQLSGVILHLSDPAQQWLTQTLNAVYPATVAYEPLILAVQTGTGQSPAQCRATVNTLLTYLIVTGGVRYRCEAVIAAQQVSEKPVAIAFEREKARQLPFSPGHHSLANVWHDSVFIDRLEYSLLPLLDGTNDHAALTRRISQLVHEGALYFLQDGQKISDSAKIHQRIQSCVTPTLESLLRKGLLVA